MIRCFAFIAVPVLSLLCSCCWNRNGVNAQPFSNVAVLVNSPLAKTDIASTIKVFRYVNQTVEFDKAVFRGVGSAHLHTLEFKGNDRRHPGKVEIQDSTVTLNISSGSETSERTGIYTITLFEDGHNSQEELRVMLLNQDTPVIPVAYSTVVQRGQGISLEVTTTASQQISQQIASLRWRRDGGFCNGNNEECGSCFGKRTCEVEDIQNPLIYECFFSGTYTQYNHAIMSIIVRDCDNLHWGEGCSKECRRCFNGGTCHDKSGLCQCPPGFSGDHCENVRGSNVFGQNGEYRCNENEAADSSACQGALICYPRPFGCICPAGYSGWNCLRECSAGKFGANCQQECHCANEPDCNPATGVCGEGDPEECASGWKGVNCQVEDPCPIGIYGDLCTLPCSCPLGNDCQEVEDNCAAGCAIPWTGAACDDDTGLGRIEEITFVKVNQGIATSVTCTGIRNPILESDDLVLKMGSSVDNDGQSTVMDRREYSLTKQWAIVTSQLSLMVECSIRDTNITQGREVSFYELPSFASTPAVLLSSDAQPTTIEVTWRTWNAERDRGEGPIVGFRVRLRAAGDTSADLVEDVSASTRTHRFDGLSPDSEYTVDVAAVREGQGGAGSYHELDTFQTPCGVSAAPNLTVRSVRPRSVTFMAEFPPEEERNCNQVTAILQQSDAGGPWTLAEALSLSQLQRVVSVYGLIPCSTYRFRIIISSSGGPVYSQTVEPETGVEGHSAVQNLTVSQGRTPATLRVTWNPPDRSSNRCPLNGYNLMYGFRRYHTCSSSTEDRSIQEVSTEEETYLIEGLKYSARYIISVVPIGGLDSVTRSVIGNTSVSAPSTSPQGVSLVVVNSTSISASWGRIECRHRNGRIEKYLYNLDADDGSVTRTGEEALNQMRDVVFADLVPYTNYSFRVQAFTVEGPGPFSVPLIATTLEDVPPQMEVPISPFGNTSSIQVVWQAPVPPHGVITDYDISYVHVDGNMNETTVRLSASDFQDRLAYLITDLLSDSTYSIKVRAYTSVGPGEFSPPLSKVTAEGIPSPPSELRVQERGLDRIVVTWNLPLKPQGRVTRYKVVYKVVFRPYDTAPCGSDCLPPVAEETAGNSLELSGLEPSTVYEVSVSATTSAGYGEPAVVNATTEVFTDLIPAPVGDIVPMREATTAVIRLPLLEQIYATGYLIRVEVTVPITRRDMGAELGSYKENSMDYITAELMKPDVPEDFKVGDNKTYGMYFNAPLNESLSYNLYVITISSVNGTRVAVTSSPIILKVIPPEGGGGGGSALTIILVILILLTVVIVLAIVVVKRRSIKSWRESKLGHRELTGAPRKAVNNTSLEMGYTESLDNLANGSVEAKGPQGPPRKPSKKMRKSVNVADLAVYVKKKKTSKKETLYDEYELLPDTQLYSWNVASKPENKTKNRYGNIVPYDQSRVVLATVNDDPHSDYINASYIDGYQSPKKYIACHGPNKASVIDFWRMVWQENCSIIVMLTNLTEGGKKKCEKYWPDDTMKYGHLMVRATNRDVYSTCTISTFIVSMADQKGGPNKEVYHYHFTAWPDMKVPEFVGPLLDLLQLVRAQQQALEQDDMGPMVVHCSAGVGRTGTFITLDAMLDMAEAEKKVNVFQFISQMRENRIKMVQVVEQYQFIFDALVEYFVIGNTAIATDQLPAEVARLKSKSSSGSKSFLQEQYETLQLVTIVPPPEKFSGGSSELNKSKNRFMDIIPVDTFRPYLMTDVGEGGTNYINASFLSGFQKKDKFLGTQMPLDNTIVDFWRMVCDYNSPIIVMLNQMDPQCMSQYWSDSEPVTFGPFTVSVLSCEDQDHIRYRQLEVTNQTSPTMGGPQTVIHLQCLDWSQDARVSYPPHKVLSLVTMVKQILEKCGDGPITVHCIDGVGRTGVFCGVYSALEQLNAEARVDVFQLVNKMRSCQPSIIQNFEQYQFIYECLLASMNDENIYENYGR